MVHGTDEAFAAKHMPDLGHEIQDFQVFSWPLQKWRTLDKKLTSPDFEAGGHKWCVIGMCHGVRRSGHTDGLSIPRCEGAYYCSRRGTRTHHQTRPYQYIWTMPIPRLLRRAGTAAPNSPSSCTTHMIPPTTSLAVSDVVCTHSLNSVTDGICRRPSPFHR